MDEKNTCDSGSWKKMVISKSNEEWIAKINSANDDQLKINSTNFPDIKIKEEKEDVPSESQELEDYNVNIQDPLLEEVKDRKQSTDHEVSPKSGTDDARERRLAKMSAYAAYRLANESPEQRAKRLKRMSEYATKRLAQETIEQRAKRLARMSAYTARRIANETSEQRQARLSKMSAYAARKNTKKKKRCTTSLAQEKDTNIGDTEVVS